jgi:hypothetical protein
VLFSVDLFSNNSFNLLPERDWSRVLLVQQSPVLPLQKIFFLLLPAQPGKLEMGSWGSYCSFEI